MTGSSDAPGPGAGRPTRSGFGATDGVLLAAGVGFTATFAAVHAFVSAAFGAMYADFGSPLPATTAWILSPAFALTLGGATVAAVAIGVFLRCRRGSRGWWLLSLAGLAVLPIVGAPAFFIGAYLPIFELADAVAR